MSRDKKAPEMLCRPRRYVLYCQTKEVTDMLANVNGIDLFYEQRGEGRPLILLHGNSEDHTIFDKALERLEKHFCCYAVDSRCHGQSGEGPLHYEDMAEDMIAFLEALDLRDVVFYGFSDGGIIGLLAAAKCDRITTLITSGANLTPAGAKPALLFLGRVLYFFTRDAKIAMMLNEPHIGSEVLGSIRAKTLVLARMQGSGAGGGDPRHRRRDPRGGAADPRGGGPRLLHRPQDEDRRHHSGLLRRIMSKHRGLRPSVF